MKTKSFSAAAFIEPLEARIAPAGVFRWNNVDGSWTNPANWTPVSGNVDQGFPNGPDDVAQFLDSGSVIRTATIPNTVSITLGELEIDDNNGVVIAATGSGRLVFGNGGSSGVVEIGTSNGTGAHTISAPITLGGPLFFQGAPGAFVSVPATISESEAGSLVFVQGGTFFFSGAASNTYTGDTYVDGGTLTLAKTGGAIAIPGALNIGVGFGTGGKVTVSNSEQIADGATLRLDGDAIFDLGSRTETLGRLELSGSSNLASEVKVGAQGVLRTGIISASGFGTVAPAITGAGALDFGAATGSIFVADHAASSDLVIRTVIKGTAGFTKSGPGTLELAATAAQQYSGTTQIAAGTLKLATSTADSGISSVITVESGATLLLVNSSEVPNNADVTLLGTGRLVAEAIDDFRTLTFATTTVGGGGVEIASGTALSIVNGGTVAVTGNGASGGTIDGPGQMLIPSGTVTFDTGLVGQGPGLTVAAVLGGAGRFVKIGAGTALVTSATYTGGTRVVAGTFEGDLTAHDDLVLDGGTFAVTGDADDVLPFGGSGGRLSLVGPLSTGDVTFNASTTFASTYAGSQLHRLTATGGVNLGGAALELSTLRFPNSTAALTLISNDGSDAITGTFAGLPEGATVTTPTGNYTISYQGGTNGNDVMLTPVFVQPTIAAGGKKATFTDRDGDLVTLTVTKGTLAADQFIIAGIGAGGQLLELDLSDPADGFAGAMVKFTAALQGGAGDRHVDVGFIDATQVNLAGLTIPGDLSRLLAGSGEAGVTALGKLTVNSLGSLGTSTQLGASLNTTIAGSVGSVKIKGDVRGAVLQLTGGKVGSISVGGSVVPGPNGNRSLIDVAGPLGSLTIGGDVIGDANASPAIQLASASTVSIGGDVRGATVNTKAGVAEIGKVTIGGSVLAGETGLGGRLDFDSVKSLTIKGDILGGSAAGSGSVRVAGVSGSLAAGSITIGGSLRGGDGAGSGVVEAASGGIGAVSVAGSIIGGDGLRSGSLLADGSVAKVTVGGSLVGGDGGSGLFAQRFGSIAIRRDVMGEAVHRVAIGAEGLTTPADAKAAMAIASLTVGGTVAYADVLAGYSDGNAASPFTADAQIGKITVKGAWIASRALAGIDSVNGKFGDADDQTLGFGGSASIASRIASIVIGGRVQGTAAGGDSFGFVAQQIGSLSVNGSKLALNAAAAPLDVVSLSTTGDVFAREVAAM